MDGYQDEIKKCAAFPLASGIIEAGAAHIFNTKPCGLSITTQLNQMRKPKDQIAPL